MMNVVDSVCYGAQRGVEMDEGRSLTRCTQGVEVGEAARRVAGETVAVGRLARAAVYSGIIVRRGGRGRRILMEVDEPPRECAFRSRVVQGRLKGWSAKWE